MLACVMVGAIMAINLGGVEWMMKMEAVLGGLSLFPTVIFVVMGASSIQPSVILSALEPCCTEALDCTTLLPSCAEASANTSATHSILCMAQTPQLDGQLQPGAVGLAVALTAEQRALQEREAMGGSLPPLELEPCSSFQGDVQWAHLFSWTLWLYGGIFGLGTMAGEIEKPEVSRHSHRCHLSCILLKIASDRWHLGCILLKMAAC